MICGNTKWLCVFIIFSNLYACCFQLFLLSTVWYGVYGLVSHRCSPGTRPHVIRLLPLHRMGGHYLLPAGRVHSYLLLLRVLLISFLPGQQSFLLLQTGRRQPASSPLHQSRQERPRLRETGHILTPKWMCRGPSFVYRHIH